MKKIVIFGAGKIADVVHYYLHRDSALEPVAFTCDSEYVKEGTFNDLPVVSFEEVTREFPPSDFAMFVALGYQKLNAFRAERVSQAGAKGYELVSFVHPDARVPDNATIGRNCFVMDHACVQPRVTIGDNVFVWGGAMIGHHSTIRENCWITSNANIAGVVTIGRNTFVAINATVANNVTVGDNCFLGANALVTRDLPDGKVVIQKPSEVIRLDSQQFLRMSTFE